MKIIAEPKEMTTTVKRAMKAIRIIKFDQKCM